MKKTQEFKSQQRVAEERSVLLDSAKTVLLCTQEKEPCTWGRCPRMYRIHLQVNITALLPPGCVAESEPKKIKSPCLKSSSPSI